MKRLILAGGGNAEKSQLVDEFFVTLLPRKKFLFIPHAIAPGIWSFERAYEWIHKPKAFHDVEITMWPELRHKEYQELDGFDALYLMGGSTFVLLQALRESGFIDILNVFLKSGRVVYGISAGAIMLGKDITTTMLGPEGEQNEIGLSNLAGLDLLDGLNVYPHYLAEQDEELANYFNENRIPFLAISEKSGVYVEDNSWRVLGYDPVCLFNERGKMYYSPGTQVSPS